MKNYTTVLGVAAMVALLAGCATNPTYRDPTEVRTYSTDFTASDYTHTATEMVRSLSSNDDVIQSVAAYKKAHNGLKPKIYAPPLVTDVRQMTIKDDLINNTIRTEIIRQGQFTFVGNEKAMADRKFAEDNSVLIAPGASSGFQTQRGADYVLTSKLTQLDDAGGRTREKTYILHMELVNLVTGEPEWAEDVPVSKFAKRAGLGW